tara:strand:- start:853 stop:1890 length:1038 start_codon:yes stop_codon:yes gene_type:complete
MNILVTGNLGYIGPVLTNKLENNGYNTVGFDIGYFADCSTSHYSGPKKQIIKDLRKIEDEDLDNIDIVIHLASLSNDPLGEFMPELTNQINYVSTMRLAEIAKKKGIKKFIFASTQSIYGISKVEEELNEDDSTKNPITAYAITKWKAEQELMQMATDNFCVVALRPSTVFGPSPRFRADIVFNNLLACAFTSKNIEIWSDGTPWRPVIHIDDVCDAFISCIKTEKHIINKQAFNVGVPGGNYTVRQIAEAAQKSFPESKLVFLNKTGNDNRTYKVNFDKINKKLQQYFKPQWDLEKGGRQLINYFNQINLNKEDFIGRKTMRLKQLKYLTENKIVNDKLEFLKK